MAEFKLGRIKFVWKGVWQDGATYIVDDVISNGGKSYICVVNHTASSEFNTDLSFVPSKWNIVADGTTWRGDWTETTYYNAGDIVKYGALVYVCKTGHESDTFVSPTYNGLETDLGKWDVFATSFRWIGDWDVSYRYLKNDFVMYGGTTYVCKNGHISAATVDLGLEDDSNNWEVFNQGIVYLGAWSDASVRYKLNDIVKYGSDLWICVNPHTSSASFDEADWDVFINGFEFENSWNNSTTYQIGDTVTYGGYSYIAKTNNTNKQPTANLSDWEVFTTGFKYRGEYDVAVDYLVGDVVSNHGYTYVAILDNVGQLPSALVKWARLNSGLKWTNNPETYSAVSAVTVTGIGSAAKFDVTRSGTVYTLSVTALQGGANYVSGDTVKILGSSIGGISPANDIAITVSTVSTGAIDTFTYSGRSVTWKDGISYLLGDVVLFGANSYIAIAPHTATSGNRPDADDVGDFWNLLTAGAEYNILTETGDLVYMGANGPTRLPVGTNGQVLRSQDGFPVWANYGLINNLVYVGPLGRDVAYPSAGATIDQPWRSVRFAAKQIEDGYLNPNAKTLLRKNKPFLMKEITNWVISKYSVTVTSAESLNDTFTCDTTANLVANMPIEFTGTLGGVVAGVKYFVKAVNPDGVTFTISTVAGGTLKQLNAGTGSMTGTLSYDHDFCERDVGLIVDAVIHDVSRGGNARTIKAAKAYYTPAGNAYINSNFGTQIAQTVAAYTYLNTLIAEVLSNTSTVSYQAVNGVTTAAPQIIDLTLTVEPGVLTLTDALMSIITTGITAGSVTAIPAAVNPTTTISMKTGTYQEVLPIVIPEFTALVGDELRSTVVQPAFANPLLVNDKAKTIAALNRINTVATDVIQNTAVTPTAGNAETQVYIGGYEGNSTTSVAVSTKTSIISNIVTNGIGSLPSTVIPDPTGYDSGFFDARRLLVANKTFIQAEVAAFMAYAPNGFSSVWSGLGSGGQANCTRDIGYIIDAIEYDLTYGGNLETIVAARSYYSLGTFVEASLEKAAALAVQAHLKTIIGFILQNDNLGWAKTSGNASLQVTAGGNGSNSAVTFTKARFQEVYDTIDTGTTPAVVEPGVSWVDSGLVSAKYAIQAKKSGIQAGAIAWINKNYPTLTYDQALCSRDIGYIVEAVAYDVMFGSNFRSIKAGMAYYRATTSAQNVIANQKAATSGVIGYVSTAIQQITNGSAGSAGSTTAVSRVEASTNIIYDIVASGLGSVPTVVLPNPTGLAANTINARTQLAQNYAFIKAEITQYLLNGVYSSVWSGIGASGQAACLRDIGYILDAVQYDLTYGGNLQSLIAGSAYYSNYSLTFTPTEIDATLDAYSRFKTIVGEIAQRISVTVTPGNSTPQVTTGSGDAVGTAAAFAQSRIQDVIDWITNGTANATITPDITWADADLQVSFAALQAKKTEIQNDTLWWVYKNHQELNFNEDTCTRDTGYIVDALSYDLVFGSNFAAVTAGRSYTRATTSAQIVINSQKTAELGAINFIKYKAKTIAAAGAAAQVTSIVSDITKFITGGSTPRLQVPNPSTITSGYAAATVLLRDNTEFIKSEVIAYITANYPSLSYSHENCSRDVGYIIDALIYDLTYGYGISGSSSNYAVRQTGLAYYSALTSVLEIASGEKTATLAAYGYLKTVAQAVAQNTTVSALGTVAQVRAATGQTVGSGAAATSIGTLVDVITTIINSLGSAPSETLPGTSWVDATLIAQNAALQSNKSSIQTTIISYINTNFPTLVYDSTTCSRDVGYIIDAVGNDLMFNTNYRSVLAGNSYYRAQASLVLSGQKAPTEAAFRYLKTLVLNVVSTDSTARARAKALMDTIIGIVSNGVGETPEVTGTLTYNNTLSISMGAETLRANKTFLASEATAYISATYTGSATSIASDVLTTAAAHNLSVGDPVVFTGTLFGGVSTGTTYFVLAVPSSTTFTITETQDSATAKTLTDSTGTMTVTYSYDPASCQRDMMEYVDALVYDLQYTGNYRALRAARLYKNAVEGSQQSDMFHVSNATGLRNCTLNGLNGTLTEINDYGTKRPTAGAFVALNPGFGPNDSSVWVTSRSHYSQNVTMFGTGCTGAKIDGAIHAGGNRSMVKNDFTTILSDGIGVWCTGADSLTELVSVFNYYGYAGYLAEFGGRIRATNGNSSYGTYGVIAEGTDTYEQPVNASVDNYNAQGQITNTVVDGSKVLRLEFQNAGSNYSNAAFSVSGDGINVYPQVDEFRDDAVFETRLIDLNDGNGVGGTNYGGALNAAQGGDVGYITIAAADVALSTAYVGMRIQVTAGTGVGQYANILDYNNGTKVAKVTKDSFTTLTVTASQVSNSLITVANTATLYVGMPIYFSAAFGTNIAAKTVYYIIAANFSTTQFAVSTAVGGTAVSLTAESGLTVSLYAAGWDHAVQGTTIVNVLDLTTGYIIEPRISYTAPGYTSTDRTLAGSAQTWKALTFGNNTYFAVTGNGTATSYSTDGTAWSAGGALSASATWSDVVYGGGSGAAATAVVGGLGGAGAVLTAVMGVTNAIGNPGADQVVSVTIIDGGHSYTTPPTIVFTPVTGGSGAVATCTVLNGKIDTVTVTINGSGYSVAPTVSAATDRLTSISATRWGRGYTSTPTIVVTAPFTADAAWSSGATVADQDIVSYDISTITHFYTVVGSGALGTTGPVHTTGTDTNGAVSLLHIGTQAAVTANMSNTGVSGYTVVSYGVGYTSVPTVSIIDSNAKYVAIANGSSDNCYLSVSAGPTAAWTAGTALSSTSFVSAAYGNGTFVIVGGTALGASSTTGATWVSRTLPTLGSGSYISVAYGAGANASSTPGTFIAISTGATLSTAVSANGQTWTAGGNLPAGFTTATSIAYGNGRFVAVASSSRTVAFSIDNGTTWKTQGAGLPTSQAWSKVSYGQGLFFAIATGTTAAATSPDGINWTAVTMPSSSNWKSIVHGNPDNTGVWAAVSNTSGSTAASIKTGARTLGRMKTASGLLTEVRLVEPGSGYPTGTVTATTVTTNVISVDNTTNLVDSQPIMFTGASASGLVEDKMYYVIGSTIVAGTSFKVSLTAGSGTAVVLSTTTGLTGTFRAGPIITQTDPNKVKTAALQPRMGDGALANPSFSNRGSGNTSATSSVTGDGRAGLYQPSTFIAVKNVYRIPQAGSNIAFASIAGTWYKLVAVTNVLGDPGNYTATFQISPGISVLAAPPDGDAVVATNKYSQVRLTGHDFLYIGTGNQAQTNYPYVNASTAVTANQELFSGGGRVFFTSTDQDGNFNVGNLFGVQQSTGTATLNADAFNLSGLQSLQLGSLNVGVASAVINQFSTDPYFTANSDNIVPTQKAIKSYITAQIGGGQSSLNVNTLTAGVIYIANDTITTTSGGQLNITAKMNFTGGIDGAPVALGFFFQR